jgi:hypothetical protein
LPNIGVVEMLEDIAPIALADLSRFGDVAGLPGKHVVRVYDFVCAQSTISQDLLLKNEDII